MASDSFGAAGGKLRAGLRIFYSAGSDGAIRAYGARRTWVDASGGGGGALALSRVRQSAGGAAASARRATKIGERSWGVSIWRSGKICADRVLDFIGNRDASGLGRVHASEHVVLPALAAAAAGDAVALSWAGAVLQIVAAWQHVCRTGNSCGVGGAVVSQNAAGRCIDVDSAGE